MARVYLTSEWHLENRGVLKDYEREMRDKVVEYADGVHAHGIEAMDWMIEQATGGTRRKLEITREVFRRIAEHEVHG